MSSKTILGSQERFRSAKQKTFTEEVDKIALSADNKRIRPLNLIETFAYKMSTNLACKNGEIKCNNITK